MVDFDDSLDALLNPGRATSYFERHGGTRFDATATGYSSLNAWWLAEMSRLVYRAGADEVKSPLPVTRDEFLRKYGFRENAFVSSDGIHCAVIEGLEPRQPNVGILVFRGTEEPRNWVTNLDAMTTAWPGGGRVHKGFADGLEAVWEKVEPALNGITGPLFYTGHSLGAALATLAAARRPPRMSYTFGSPLVGDPAFGRTIPPGRMFRIVNDRDVVTTVPKRIPPQFDYVHCGDLRCIRADGTMGTSGDTRQVVANTISDFENLFDRRPPKWLSDHAPVNYVAHMERLVPG
jgi:triacylglycerol lipase